MLENDHKLCVNCLGDYSCNSHYIDETKRNADVRWNKHNNRTKNSEALKLW